MTEQSGWIETTATVVSCTYQFARMNTLLMGMQTGEKYRIAFDYVAHGQTYSDAFQSAVAIPQNERLILRYNPLEPQQNDRSSSEVSTRPSALIRDRCCRFDRPLTAVAGSASRLQLNYAMMSWITLPETSVRRKSRPLERKVSLV